MERKTSTHQHIGDIARRLVEQRAAALQHVAATEPERVAMIGEVEYLNDSRSTFLDATLQSLAGTQGDVVWIAGASMAPTGAAHVQDLLRRRVASVVVFGADALQRVEELAAVVPHVYATGDVRTATFLARELAVEGTTVLFSPACPSGEGFANYEERAAEFKRAVRDL